MWKPVCKVSRIPRNNCAGILILNQHLHPCKEPSVFLKLLLWDVSTLALTIACCCVPGSPTALARTLRRPASPSTLCMMSTSARSRCLKSPSLNVSIGIYSTRLITRFVLISRGNTWWQTVSVPYDHVITTHWDRLTFPHSRINVTVVCN